MSIAKSPRALTVIAAALFVALFSGCVSTAGLDQNEELSIDFNVDDYGEVYFLPPEEDPRAISPKITEALREMGFSVNTMDRERPLEGTQGSGFFVAERYVLTCAHVVGDETEGTVWLDSVRYEADVAAIDEDVDLALLKLRRAPAMAVQPLVLDGATEPAMGDDVFTIGYPMAALLGDQARLTKGLVSASQGIKGDPDQFQITAAIQPGNSGGPVFTEKGAVRGVVTQTLNTLAILQSSGGAAPQNVNFAVKPEVVENFLRANLPDYASAPAMPDRDIASVKASVVKVRSGILPAHLEGKAKLVVVFDYDGFWDMWYRFNVFLISAFDFDTGERIFTAGQVGDNLISNEEVVIDDTLAEVRRALGKVASN